MSLITGNITHNTGLSLPSVGSPTQFSVPANLPKLDRQYQAGTGAHMADGVHCKAYSLVATSTTLDLTAMTDPNGTAIVCTTGRVREFLLQNTSNQPIIIGNAAATQWAGMISTPTGTLTVPPFGIQHFADPTTVGAGLGAVVDATHKSLKIDAGSNTVTFNLLMLFCSAQT